MNKKKTSSKIKKKVESEVAEHISSPLETQTTVIKGSHNQLYILGGIFLASAIVAGSLTNVTYNNLKNSKRPSQITKVIQPSSEEILKSDQIDPYALLTADRSLESTYELIDLRDNESYKKGHIKKSVNIPYQHNTLDLAQLDKSKYIIFYSYTDYSTDGENARLYLQKKGYKVSILKTGWNTFRHFSNLWIPENKWGTVRVDDYIESDNT